MKTKNLLLGLGIAAGAFLTVTAIRRNGSKMKEYVSKGLEKVNVKKEKKESKKEQLYV